MAEWQDGRMGGKKDGMISGWENNSREKRHDGRTARWQRDWINRMVGCFLWLFLNYNQLIALLASIIGGVGL